MLIYICIKYAYTAYLSWIPEIGSLKINLWFILKWEFSLNWETE